MAAVEISSNLAKLFEGALEVFDPSTKDDDFLGENVRVGNTDFARKVQIEAYGIPFI